METATLPGYSTCQSSTLRLAHKPQADYLPYSPLIYVRPAVRLSLSLSLSLSVFLHVCACSAKLYIRVP